MTSGMLRSVTLFLVGVAFLESCAFICIGQLPLQQDALGYWDLGSQVANGDIFLVDQPQAFRPFFYPLFLGFCQYLFGSFALIAAVAFQQVWLWATALLVAWLCVRLTKHELHGAVALLLGVMCFRRHYIATQMFSDNLLGLLLAGSVVVLFLWLEKPTIRKAVGIGILVGCCTLTKPIAQFYWLPILFVMWLELRRTHSFSKFLPHASGLLIAFAVVLSPWLVRNHYCFGEVFLTKFAGRALWWSCFQRDSDHPLKRAVPFSDGPATKQVLSEIKGVSTTATWSVYAKLLANGRTEIETDELMKNVCMESIKAHPVEFMATRVGNVIVFWTMEGTDVSLPLDIDASKLNDEVGPSYRGNERLQIQSVAKFLDHVFNVLWPRRRLIYIVATGATIVGFWLGVRDRQIRLFVFACFATIAYFCAVTCLIGAPSGIRYRTILEPLMIILVVIGLARLIGTASKKRCVI